MIRSKVVHFEVTGNTVAELCRSLIAEVQQFSATQSFDDDVCLVAMDIDRLKSL